MWTIEFKHPPGIPPWSVNQKLHWAQRAEKVRAWRAASCAAAQKQVGQELPPCLVQVELPFERAARRDAHNYSSTVVKAVVDGLCQPFTRTSRKGELVYSPGAGLFQDDTPEFVRCLDPLLTVRDDGLVVVTLFER